MNIERGRVHLVGNGIARIYGRMDAKIGDRVLFRNIVGVRILKSIIAGELDHLPEQAFF